jgi:hypothetical protein
LSWSRWVGLWDRREDGLSLALVRMGVGLGLVHAMAVPAARGLVPVIWFDRAQGGYKDLGEGMFIVRLLGGPSPGLIWSLVGLCLLSGGLLIAGLGARWAALVGLQCFLGLSWLNGQAGGSYDFLLANALWLVVLAESDRTASLWARLSRGAWLAPGEVPSWPRYLMVVQLVLMYFATGIQKVSAHWVPGGDWSALYYILQQPSWQRWRMEWAAWVYPLTQAATGAVWFFEVGAPLLLLAFWYRDSREQGGALRATFNRVDLRALFCMAGVSMHLGIATLMDVGPFSTVAIALYAALWHPEELRRWLSARSRPPAAGRPSPP